MTIQKHDRQADKFVEAAREAEADESPDALDRIMGKLDLKKKPEPEKYPEHGREAKKK